MATQWNHNFETVPYIATALDKGRQKRFDSDFCIQSNRETALLRLPLPRETNAHCATEPRGKGLTKAGHYITTHTVNMVEGDSGQTVEQAQVPNVMDLYHRN